jgi:hypothetical protein
MRFQLGGAVRGGVLGQDALRARSPTARRSSSGSSRSSRSTSARLSASKISRPAPAATRCRPSGR